MPPPDFSIPPPPIDFTTPPPGYRNHKNKESDKRSFASETLEVSKVLVFGSGLNNRPQPLTKLGVYTSFSGLALAE